MASKAAEEVICDACGGKITTKFRSCSDCVFDLCQTCWPNRKKVHAEHDSWDRVDAPRPATKEKRPVSVPGTPVPAGVCAKVCELHERMPPPQKKQAIDVQLPPFPYPADRGGGAPPCPAICRGKQCCAA